MTFDSAVTPFVLCCACAKFESSDVWIVIYEFATTAAVHQLSQIWRVLSRNGGEYVVQIWGIGFKVCSEFHCCCLVETVWTYVFG